MDQTSQFQFQEKAIKCYYRKGLEAIFFSVLIFSVALETLLTFFSFHSIPMTWNIEDWRNC